MTDRTSIIGGIICFTLVLLLWALCPRDLAGAERGGLQGSLLSDGSILELTLEADFKVLKGDRGQESTDRPGRILLYGSDGSSMEIPISVRTRGNFRLQKTNCSFPPLRLDLPEGELAGTPLEGQDKLKLVTHCRDRDDYEQNLLEEYLAYRIYNLITDVSFKVQLARIRYVDARGKMKPVTRFAFLLEGKKAMADRLGGTFLRVPQVHPDRFDPQASGAMYLFQYLIGNVDWSLAYFHNVKLVRVGSDHLPVAYDFDWSGLVYAPYAKPHPELADRLRSVRQRLYRGFCSDGIDYAALTDRFWSKREGILTEIGAVPGLNEKNAKSARKYVREFFETLQEEKRLESKVVKACRPLPKPPG